MNFLCFPAETGLNTASTKSSELPGPGSLTWVMKVPFQNIFFLVQHMALVNQVILVCQVVLISPVVPAKQVVLVKQVMINNNFFCALTPSDCFFLIYIKKMFYFLMLRI